LPDELSLDKMKNMTPLELKFHIIAKKIKAEKQEELAEEKRKEAEKDARKYKRKGRSGKFR